MQALPMIPCSFAGLPWPRPFPLCVRETRPGENIMIGQVQIGRIHRELTNELQQTCETVQQPLQREKRRNVISTAVQLMAELGKRTCPGLTSLQSQNERRKKPLQTLYDTDVFLTLTTVQDSCSFGSKIAELKMSSRS